MNTVIIGNGILGLTTAYRLVQRDPKTKIKVIGPFSHKGCASLAAAAMLNSFCEVDAGTLSNKIEREKFMLNRAAVPLWPEFLEQLQETANQKIHHGFGTNLIDNHSTDELEDENFQAVLDALKEFKEPYEVVNPKNIPNYLPAPQARAARAIYIPNEGWVNPVQLIAALKMALVKSDRVQFIDQSCKSINKTGDSISSVTLEDGQTISGDNFLLAAGANFSEILKNSDLKLNLPRIFYGIGCSILLKTGEFTLNSCLRTPNRGLACGIYAAPFDKEHMVVGASNFISPSPEEYVRLTSIHTLLESAMEQINSHYYRAQLVKVNVGWRPTSADTVPIIGKTSISNLVVATGTKRDGLHCSPIVSKFLSDLLIGKDVSYDLSLFKPERELVRIYTREEAIDTSVKHTLNAAYQHGFKPAKNRMVEDLKAHYTYDLTQLHDKVGASSWGIPPEMINMYRYGHIQ